jgi:hypothetical protein
MSDTYCGIFDDVTTVDKNNSFLRDTRVEIRLAETSGSNRVLIQGNRLILGHRGGISQVWNSIWP